jgi:hypothetical protein
LILSLFAHTTMKNQNREFIRVGGQQEGAKGNRGRSRKRFVGCNRYILGSRIHFAEGIEVSPSAAHVATLGTTSSVLSVATTDTRAQRSNREGRARVRPCGS